MTTRALRDRLWFKATVLVGFWTLLGLSFAAQLYLTQSKIGTPVTWRFAIGRALADWYVFALLSLPAMWLARRFRIERGTGWRSVGIHLAAGAAFSVAWMVVRAWVEQVQSRGGQAPVTFGAAFEHALVATFVFNVVIYWVIVTVSHTFDFYRRYHERELRTLDLEKRLAQAQLEALQMQLNPHFLFNTLHGISALMHEDVEAADRVVARLSDLLRRALDSSRAQTVPLRQELAFLEDYLEIEKIRFGDRLCVQYQIEPETLDAQVPNLILQPLVENAIRHGIEPHARPGRVELSARRSAGELLLEVRDNGAGLAAAGATRNGVGLSNTRARLEQLYGKTHRFTLANESTGGLVVEVRFPFSTHETARADH